jgi:hypothetical protein
MLTGQLIQREAMCFAEQFNKDKNTLGHANSHPHILNFHIQGAKSQLEKQMCPTAGSLGNNTSLLYSSAS